MMVAREGKISEEEEGGSHTAINHGVRAALPASLFIFCACLRTHQLSAKRFLALRISAPLEGKKKVQWLRTAAHRHKKAARWRTAAPRTII